MGAATAGTDCHWGPKAGIIGGSDVPFSGLHPHSWSPPPALEQPAHRDGELNHSPYITARETEGGKGLVHSPSQVAMALRC